MNAEEMNAEQKFSQAIFFVCEGIEGKVLGLGNSIK